MSTTLRSEAREAREERRDAFPMSRADVEKKYRNIEELMTNSRSSSRAAIIRRELQLRCHERLVRP